MHGAPVDAADPELMRLRRQFAAGLPHGSEAGIDLLRERLDEGLAARLMQPSVCAAGAKHGAVTAATPPFLRPPA